MTTVAITGADGFLGQAVLRSPRLQGAAVIAIRRRPAAGSADLDAASPRLADLRDPTQVEGVLEGVDTVVHLAAAMQGGFHDQYESTVRATANLLREATRSGVSRFVLVSSFAVYDYGAARPMTLIDEAAPIDHAGVGRDAYAQTKVLQERICREWAARTGARLIIARPGVVYGRDKWWTYRIGERFGRLWLCFGNKAQVPLAYVDNCADALVHLALETSVDSGAYNIFDDDPPTQREYRVAVASRTASTPVRAVFGWPLAAALAQTATRMNERRRVPLRLPSFLHPASMAVRAKPLRYSNRKLRATGWAPSATFPDTLDQVFPPQEP